MSARDDLLPSLDEPLRILPFLIFRAGLEFDELAEMDDLQLERLGLVEHDDREDELCCLQLRDYFQTK